MKSKSILVTGGSGFIGGEIVFQLSKLGYRVCVLDINKPLYNLPYMRFVQYDLRRISGLKKILTDVDVCIHLAALTGNSSYGISYQSKMFEDNSLIDINTISSAAKAGVKKFIYISSSLVYERSTAFPVKEEITDLLPAPRLAYSFEKLIGERTCEVFAKDYNMDYTICRLFNAYGINSNYREDVKRHVIADLLGKILEGQYPVQILGDGNQKRNFTHVEDLAAGILATIFNKHALGQTFNLGNSKEYSVFELLEMIWKLAKMKKPLKIKHLPSVKNDVVKNYPDLKKTEKILNWKAQISVEEGIKDLIAYKRSTFSAQSLQKIH